MLVYGECGVNIGMKINHLMVRGIGFAILATMMQGSYAYGQALSAASASATTPAPVILSPETLQNQSAGTESQQSEALAAPTYPLPTVTPPEAQADIQPPDIHVASPTQDIVPPSGATSQTATAATAMSGTALPDAGTSPVRSPGMELPVEAGLPSGPTAVASRPPKTPEEIKYEIREESFNAALTGLMPLEPPEIRKVLQRFDQTKEATETPIYPFPQPESVVANISLDPGAEPFELKVASGNVTTVGILDASGAPWPIKDMTWAGNFEIVQPESGGHIFRITPTSEFAHGNISIRLIELKTPVTFTIRTHRDTVHYRVDARMPDYGPTAAPPIIAAGITIAAGDKSMTTILEGAMPENAKKLEVSGVDGRTTAYKYKNSVYLRTPLSMLSPAWSGSVKSADGMNVYVLENAPVVLLSDQGRMVRARLGETKDDKK